MCIRPAADDQHFPQEPGTVMSWTKTLSADKVYRSWWPLSSLEGKQQGSRIAKDIGYEVLVEIFGIRSECTCRVFWLSAFWQSRRVISDSFCPGLPFCHHIFYLAKNSLQIKICIAKVPVHELKVALKNPVWSTLWAVDTYTHKKQVVVGDRRQHRV